MLPFPSLVPEAAAKLVKPKLLAEFTAAVGQARTDAAGGGSTRSLALVVRCRRQ